RLGRAPDRALRGRRVDRRQRRRDHDRARALRGQLGRGHDLNTDVWDHSHYLRAYMHDLELAPELVGTLPVLELPGTLPPAGLPPEITPVEDVWGGAEVTAEEFLSQLQDILSSFLDQLTATLGATAPPPPAGGGGGTYGEALQV